jgi:hypothetical protein
LFREVVASLAGCKAPPEGVFASRVDYLHHARFAMRHCGRGAVSVHVSDGYLVVQFGALGRASVYLYGLAGGRLFVNRVQRAPASAPAGTAAVEGREIRVYRSSDWSVWEVLGYDRDAEGEVVEVEEPGRYRIQGDLCVEAGRPYHGQAILGRLAEHQEALLLDLAARALTARGLSVRAEGMGVRVPLPRDPRIGGLLEAVAGLLYEELGALGVVGGRTEGGLALRGAGGYRNCDVVLEPYVNTVSVYAVCKAGDAEGTVAGRLYEELQASYKPATLEFMVGNHHVRLEGARSLNIVYRPSLQPAALGDRMVPFNYGGANEAWYLATPETAATITHPEHGVAALKFKQEFAVRFYTLTLDEQHYRERNAVVLELQASEP